MSDLIKAVSVSPRVHLADPQANKNEIISIIKSESEKGADLIVFPELCVTGYTCGDLFFQNLLITEAEKAVKEIKEATKGIGSVIVIGAPLYLEEALYDCGIVLCDGEVVNVTTKNVPEDIYGLFQSRIFAFSDEEPEIIYPFKKYPAISMEVLIGNENVLHGADIAVNISEGLDYIGRNEERVSAIKNAGKYAAVILSTCAFGESTTDGLYSGIKAAAQDGKLLGKKCARHEGNLEVFFDVKMMMDREIISDCIDAFYPEEEKPKIAHIPFFPEGNTDHLLKHALDIQSRALMLRMESINCKKAVIGISGGLDSTLALLVAVNAFKLAGLDLKNIYAYTMPCFGTSETTRSFAHELMSELGVSYKEINISESVRAHLKDIGHDENIHNVAYENAQARERTQILMDIANDIGAIVVGTGDMSEIALGWCTYNGDHMSNYGVNAGVPKTLVRMIVDYIARSSDSVKLSKLLRSILDIPVSPELVPGENGQIGQKTEDIIGPYDIHDFILYYVLSYGADPKLILDDAVNVFKGKYDKELIKNTMKVFYKRFFSSQFKRSCMPDGPQVLDISLSPRCGFKAPSDAIAKIWTDSTENL